MELDPAEVRTAFGGDVGEVTLTPIDPQLRFHSVTGGVFRASAADGSSLVIKVVRHGEDADPEALWVSGADPGHRNYWKREWLAYRSGLLDRLPGQLRAPRTLLTTEPSPHEGWIWMEDVDGRAGATWPVGDYDSAAFDLGTTQGAFAAGGAPMPTYEWLARDWLRGWVDALARHTPVLEDDAWPGEIPVFATLRDRLRALWANRESLLDVVVAAPRCVVHCDFWPTNLIAADDGTTVAVDWSQVGIGAVGQDLDQIVLDPIWMQVLPDGDIDSLESHVLAAYLAGLRSAGFEADASELRRWYAAAAAARYGPMFAMYAESLRDPARVAALEARHGRAIDAITADKARVAEHAASLAEEVLGSGA